MSLQVLSCNLLLIEVWNEKSQAREYPQRFDVILNIEPPVYIDRTSRGSQGIKLFSTQSRNLSIEYITDLLNYFGILQFKIEEEFLGGLFLERNYHVVG